MDLCTPLPSLDLIIQRYNIYKNKREQLLLWLVIAFSRCCRLIYQYNKNYESWTELSNTLFQLHDSEKRLIGQHTKNAITFSQSLLDTIRNKSVMPFLSTYFISKVAWPSILEEENVKDICNTVGNIFWISDDLADFVKDLKSGTPNCVLIYAEHNNIQIGQNHSFGKSIFHVALLHVIEHLLSLLQQLDGSLISTNELREFVRMYITAWLKC